MSNPSLQNSPNLDSWIVLEPDGAVRVKSGKVDIGQRVSTALSILVGEELEINPARIIIDAPDTSYPDEGMTSGSNSMMQAGNALRAAAATARRHLIVRAAEKLNADPSNLILNDGLIFTQNTNQSLTYREALDGSTFDIPVDPDVALKSPADYRWIGKAHKPRSMANMVNGSMPYLHDMALPEMLHARCIRPPNYRARLQSLNDSAVENLQMEGFIVVCDGSFLAIAGDDEYPVIKAAERLARAASWDRPTLNTVDLYGQLTSNACESRPVFNGTPKDEPVPVLHAPPAHASVTLTARYDKPYIMHGSIGPSAAMAWANASGTLTVWSHSQGIQPLKSSIAEAVGMNPDDLLIQHVPGAGCYGHNGADDVSFDAVLVALAIPGRPVLMKWTREDEHTWEPYGSAMSMKLRGSLNADGEVIDWSHESYSDTHLGRPRPTPGGEGPSRLLAALHREDPAPPFQPNPSMATHAGLHRNIDPYYTIQNVRAVKNLVHDLPLRTSALRCLGGYANIFALESFMDELAHHAGIDPVSFRLRHLNDQRACDVIEAAAKGIGWLKERADDIGRGLAFSRYCNSKTYTAVAVELSVNEAAEINIHKAVVAADAGEVTDAAGLKMQLEGGFLQAVSWTLYEEVNFDSDGITSRDWETYPILTFPQAPRVDVIILDRPGKPALGAGEASSEPVAAAIANALFDSTQIRVRRLPLNPENLRQAASV